MGFLTLPFIVVQGNSFGTQIASSLVAGGVDGKKYVALQ